MLLLPLRLKLGDLVLHGPKVLLHRREHLQHLAFGALTLLLRGLFGTLALQKLAVLLLKAAHLLVKRIRRRLHTSKFGDKS